MDPAALAELQRKARALRRHIIRMIHESGTAGHYGGSLSCVEILACLFFRHLRHNPAESGYFPVERLSTFKRFGSILQGHPDRLLAPGVEMSTGSLGQGLSAGLGMALAGRLDGRGYRVYVLLGDGELDEGQRLGGGHGRGAP